jgi:LacI family transcriptional regulator
MVRMKDVAKHAGVSSITVSRVVNNSGYVRSETRARVEAAIEELQYVPNSLASNLRSQQSDFIALVLPDITNSFWTTIARGAEDEAWTHGYGIFICNTDNNPDKEASYIRRLLQNRVEGVLIVPTPVSSSELQLDLLRKNGVKFVAIHRRLARTTANVVRSDGEGAAYRLTAELARSGRRRIAFAALSPIDPSSQERLKGYRHALLDGGLVYNENLVRYSGEEDPQNDGRAVIAELLRGSEPPDAIMLANSRLAMGGLRAIEQAGRSIPDDIMVAAFHDIRALDPFAPKLITAVQPAHRMGQLAARRLLEMTKATDDPFKEIILEPRIQIGALATPAGMQPAPPGSEVLLSNTESVSG